MSEGLQQETLPAPVLCPRCAVENRRGEAYCESCGGLLDPTPEPSEAFQIDLDYDPRLNLAMQQNSIPTIKRLAISSPDPINDLELQVTIEPGFSEPWTTAIPALPALFEAVQPTLRPEPLINLHERQDGHVKVVLTRKSQPVHEQRWPLEILAYNQWNGSLSMPELLAAFVMPNHPALQPLLKKASQFLQEWTQDASLDGYQSKSRDRVRQIAAALYAAVQDAQVTYAPPPASFELGGQKIRTPDQILEERMGTCLDLTCLFAAALEQSGLNAVLVLVKGHAFPGVWLIDHHSQKTFSEEPGELVNRCKLGELCLFDSSAAAQRVPFETAEQTAAKNLSELTFALDLKACRLRRFRPLPMRHREGYAHIPEQAPDYTPQAPGGEVPTLPAPSGERKALDPTQARLERWKNRLLDLTLRNRLLNYKVGARSLPLLGNAAQLEDHLNRARSKGLQLFARPDKRDQRALEGAELPELQEELRHGRVYVDLPPAELDKRVLELFRTSRTTLEETGSNTLYLAVGFLRWFESKTSEREILSPLLLYPAEIVRGTAQEPFRLRLTDEEPRVNATLLRKLETDFGMDVAGLDELPEDEDGLDVPLVLQRFRQAIVANPRWNVVEEAQVGPFSFAKYLMWLDLEQRRDQLMESPPVARLVLRRGDEGAMPDYANLDSVRAPGESYCLVDADSSQLEAIYSAEDGHSFVLEGPPGTGKSQTITNLIAQMLARGRSVLFVSEKQCALNVVHHRLAQVGLGPFCLELHSNKASKAEVLQQLREVAQLTRQGAPRDWEARAGQLGELREHLNAYSETLHAARPLGLTVYQVIGELALLGEGPRAEMGDLVELTRETLLRWEQHIQLLQRAADTAGSIADHPCREVGQSEWSAEWQDGFLAQVERANRAWGEASSALDRLRSELGLDAREWSQDDLERSTRLCQNALATPGETRGLLTGPGWKERRRQAEEWLAWVERRQELWQSLEPHYSEKVLGLPLDLLQPRFAEAARSHGFVAFFKFWGDRSQLKPALKGKLRAYKTVAEDLTQAIEIVDLDRRLGEAPAQALFGTAWQGWRSDTADLRRRLDWAETTREDLIWLEDGWRNPGASQRLIELSEQGSDLSSRAGGRALQEARTALDGLKCELDRLTIVQWAPSRTEPVRFTESFQSWKSNSSRLRDWSLYVRARDRAAQDGLEPLTRLHARGAIATAELMTAFRRSVLSRWLAQTTSREPALKHFHGDEQSARVEQFQQIDRQMLAMARQVVAARLLSQVPDVRNAPDSSEAGVLNREFQKQRRHLPTRKLFQLAPRLVRQLKPCFLMSPLSVAQFLDPAMPAFDLVVFDEASQIPVWDGIGALARGRQAVVVGDSKQLPPTAFFSRGEGEAELSTEEDYEDLESILNECGSAGFPSRYLRWHYRSKHEDLILFSNHHYYESRLFTFPPALAQSGRFGVSLRPVPGFYDRGVTRTNKFEAQAVVADIVRRLTDPKERERSLGVVTFSQPQQVLVEDMLDQARRDRPELEAFFGPKAAEPVFVKNLENVQGDERDVILFSIGYGPDAQGKVTMNFGPLNRQGGERRLNVAVSRARQQLVVFATLRADQIDLTRVSARGVRDLKNYLEFAARGPQALAAAPSSAGPREESHFEEVVAAALRSRGWTVHPAVGCSGYRVDLGVVHPDHLGRYLMGVECDGASYHSGRCARDRDRLRESVLRSLGWDLIRIWSTDWWADPGRQIERVHQALEERLRNGAVEVEEVVVELAPPPLVEETSMEFAGITLPSVNAAQPFDRAASRPEVTKLVQAVLAHAPLSVKLAAQLVIQPWGGKATARIQGLVGRAAVDQGAREVDGYLWRGDQDPAVWREFRPGLIAKLEDICPEELANAAENQLAQYGSMPRADLARLVASLFGTKRLGSNVVAQLDRAMDLLVAQSRAVAADDRLSPP